MAANIPTPENLRESARECYERAKHWRAKMVALPSQYRQGLKHEFEREYIEQITLRMRMRRIYLTFAERLEKEGAHGC